MSGTNRKLPGGGEWDREVVERFREADDLSEKWRNDAKENYDFVNHRQFSKEEEAYLEESGRPPITMNRISPIVQSIIGHQIQNRQEIRYFPRELGDTQINEMYTGAAKWADDNCDAEDEETDAFRDLIIAGMGWTSTHMEYDNVLEGMLVTERLDPLYMWWDMKSTHKNLSDSQWRMNGTWMDNEEAFQRWPDKKDAIMARPTDVTPDIDEDELRGSTGDRYETGETPDIDSDFFKKDRVFVLRHQFWRHEPVYQVSSPVDGTLKEVSQEQFAEVREDLDQMGVRYVRQFKKVYYEEYRVGEIQLEVRKLGCSHFTMICMTGIRDRRYNTWMGVVSGIKDPQRWSNKFFCDMQDIIASNRSGGAFIELGALINPREAEEKWNKPNAMIMVQDGAISNNKILERGQAPYPAGLDSLYGFAVNAIREVSGINLEFLGMVDRDQPGILEAQRKQAGMAILTEYFGALRQHRKQRGRVMLYYIQNFLADGRLIRVMGGDGKEKYLPLDRQEKDEVAVYDVVIDETPNSVNQKEETFTVLQALLPSIVQMGIPIPPNILDYVPFPTGLVEDWKKMLEPDPQQQQMQQRAQEVELRQEEARAAKDESQAGLNEVKAMAEQIRVQIEAMQAQFQTQVDAMGAATDRFKVISDMVERSVSAGARQTIGDEEPKGGNDGRSE